MGFGDDFFSIKRLEPAHFNASLKKYLTISLIQSFVLYLSCYERVITWSFIVHAIVLVSGQLAPKTIRPGRLAPESTKFTMFLLFVFYRGFLRTIQYYMFLLFTSYKRFSAVLKLKSTDA